MCAPIWKTNTIVSLFLLSCCYMTHDTATAMHFPPNSGLIFLTDEMTNDKYLVDTGARFSIVPHKSDSMPSGPLLREANGLPIPSWGFIMKAIQFQGKLFTLCFCKLQWQDSF
jgi:hypothetical protein